METVGGIAVLLVFIALVGASIWFWIWALLDAARASRTGWVVAIALTQALGALAYVLWGRPQNRAR